MSDNEHIDCDNQLNEAEDRIIQLQAELATAKADNDQMSDLIEAVRQEKEDWLAGMLESELKAELDKAKDKNKRLRYEIQAQRQWQTCPSCNKVFATQS